MLKLLYLSLCLDGPLENLKELITMYISFDTFFFFFGEAPSWFVLCKLVLVLCNNCAVM